jgi:hypothetical protein
MNDEGTRSRTLFVALASTQTKINSKNVTSAIFLAVKIGRFFEYNPDRHEFSDIIVGDRGWIIIFKCVADVNT